MRRLLIVHWCLQEYVTLVLASRAAATKAFVAETTKVGYMSSAQSVTHQPVLGLPSSAFSVLLAVLLLLLMRRKNGHAQLYMFLS